MKLYHCSWIYHYHYRFRLTLRDIHRWFAKLERAANQRQEFIHESTPAETQAVLIRNCTNLKKHRRNRREQKTPLHFWSEVFEVINTIWQRPGEIDGTKKLHSISEVKCSRSSTLFDNDPKFTARLFWDSPITESDCPAYAKKPDWLAINCKSSGFSI